MKSQTWWLFVAVVALAVVAYELVGMNPAFVGIHTISYEAFLHPAIRFAVAMMGLIFVAWWLWHSSTRKQK